MSTKIKKKKEHVMMSVRMEEKNYDTLRRASFKEHRSMNGLINEAVEETFTPEKETTT